MKKIFDFTEDELLKLGAINTVKEIYQQPDLWRETFEIIKNNETKLKKLKIR